MEISEEMGLSVGAVKARLFQGRKRLRKELENMAPETTMPMETPETLNIDIFGECGNQHDPLHPLRQTDNLLAKRLLYFCRKGAKSVGELSRLLHADRAYVQDIVPSLVEGEMLEESFPGRYQTTFLFIAHQEYLPLEESVHLVREGVAILRRRLPQLREALSHTSLCGWQGFTWEELAWIALPEWIVKRGLGRQVSSLPNWGKHSILTYPHLGFLGFAVACRQLTIACREEGLIPDPVDPPRGFGCHAWYGAPRLMCAWSKGR